MDRFHRGGGCAACRSRGLRKRGSYSNPEADGYADAGSGADSDGYAYAGCDPDACSSGCDASSSDGYADAGSGADGYAYADSAASGV